MANVQSSHVVSVGWPVYDNRETQAVLRALKEKRISQGKFVREFESAWAKYIGRRYAIAVNSGSSANLVAVFALKEHFRWKDGDNIIVPALTFPTAVSPVIQAGLTPVYADVDLRGNLTFDSVLRAAKGKRVKGIVLVHSLGVPCLDAVKIRRWAMKKRIAILEDACESHGAMTHGKKTGAFGTISTTSFFVAHNMTTGEGGMIATDDPKLEALCRSLREFGRRNQKSRERYVPLASGPRYDIRYAFDRLGFNVRMTDIEASLGLVQLAKLDRMNAKRRTIVRWYRQELRELIQKKTLALPLEPAGTRNTYYTLLITLLKMPRRFPTMAKVAMALEAKGIETRTFMGGNLLRQKAFATARFRPERFPRAGFLHRQSFFVGCHPLVTRSDVRFVCREVKALFS